MTKRKKEPDWLTSMISPRDSPGIEAALLKSDRDREWCHTTGEHSPYPGSKLCRRCGWIEQVGSRGETGTPSP